MDNDRGITLVELIMVICIISIILLIPTLRYGSILNNSDKREITEFKNDINYARNRAIIESTIYYVTIIPNSSSYRIYKQESMRRLIKKKNFDNGMIICGNNFGGNEIVFNRSGSPLRAGTVELRGSRGKSIEVTIAPATGKVNIYFK
ncbi:MAG: prepilin-type N-terminal cleavage/methylation domain-containing protein [Tissierellia bacterium]|nr:prepilin-type N-terminal cleavage/methylation domain-containing protein [Tissierellia bacterium]